MQNKYLYLVLLAGLLIAGCRKTEDYKFTTDLGIDARIVRLNQEADTTRIIVYSEGDWTVQTAKDAPWVTLLTGSGSGKGQALVQVTSNAGNLPRSVKLVISAKGKTDTVDLQQRGLTPTVNILDASAMGIANGGNTKTAITTNVPLELMTVNYRYETPGQTNWVSGLSVKDGALYFKLDTNHTPLARTVVMQLSYLDALGTTVKDSLKISQHPGMDYSGAVAKDFAYIKTMLAAGPITENIYVEGVIVSDKGNPNIAKNLNTPANKHVLDKTENAISVYIQSNDGKSGLYIKTKTAGDNIFQFNDRVKIWLKGATLTKATNPNRELISGIEALNIMQKEEGTAPLLPRELNIGSLTDNDLYTFVKLKDVELSIPAGAFTNINEGYIARMDCYPSSIRDIDGNYMYMLMNLDVPYRRDGKQVPQGSGSISGVLVSEQLERYAGIGKYGIRPLMRDHIALAESRSSGFSNILVEWSAFRNEFAATPTPTANPLTPVTGSGRLTHSSVTTLNFTPSGIFTSVDYNGLPQDPAGLKGTVTHGGWAVKNWWKTNAATGEYWLIEVSTAGINNPVSLQVEGSSDIGGPRNFIAEWSADNSVWTQAGTFTFEDVANWTSTLLTQVAGNKAVNINLPQAASGLEKLYVRLRVANKNVGTSTAATGGTLGTGGTSRLVHVSMKYNK